MGKIDLEYGSPQLIVTFEEWIGQVEWEMNDHHILSTCLKLTPGTSKGELWTEPDPMPLTGGPGCYEFRYPITPANVLALSRTGFIWLPRAIQAARLNAHDPIKGHVQSLRETIAERVKAEFKSDQNALYKLAPRDFERLIAEILRERGFDVYLTKETRDGGRDILAYSKMPIGPSSLIVVECKRWRIERKIEPDLVRSFLFTIRDQDRATRGMIVTTASFTSGARALQDKYKYILSLHDHAELKEWLQQYGNYEQISAGGIWLPAPCD